MTERLTRMELIFKVPRKDAASVVAVLDHLQRCSDFRHIFKSITMDNGVEFSNAHRLETPQLATGAHTATTVIRSPAASAAATKTPTV